MRLLPAALPLSSQFMFAVDAKSLALIPQPASIQTTGNDFTLANGFDISTPNYSDAPLRGAIDRAVHGTEFRSAPLLQRTGAPKFVVDCKARGSEIPKLGDDESYSLEVT